MADTDTWMPIYLGDYLSATQRLTCEQHGAYFLLIMDYWCNGPPPDDDDVLMQIAKVDRVRWRKHRPILERLFQVENGIWKHKRIDAELEKARSNVEKRREAGKAGAAKRWHSGSNANAIAEPLANASQTDRPSPSPSPKEEGDEEGENLPLPHRALAFSGRTIRLNSRDFAEWERRYSAIPDLRAELGALDDWLRGQGDDKRKNWFHVVSGSLARKHQKAVADAKLAGDDGEREYPIC